MLPLSSDGINADGILGATEYLHSQLYPVWSSGDFEEWFAMEPRTDEVRKDRLSGLQNLKAA